MLIGIDAGHRSTTPGKRTPPLPYDIDLGYRVIKAGEQFREHEAAVGVCVKLDAALKRCGLNTYKVAWNDADGTDDEYLDDLGDRQMHVLEGGCDLLLSLHFNAYGNGSAFTNPEGVETFYHSTPARAGDSARLADTVQRCIIQATGQRDREVKKDTWSMTDCIMMGTKAAVLIELAFMTNEREAVEMMANPDYWQTAAEAICKGVCEYSGVNYVPERTEDIELRYTRVTDIPEKNNFRAIINMLMDAKILNGDGSDPDGNNDVIDLSHDMVRMFIFMYRGGLFDEELAAVDINPGMYR